MLVCSFPNLSLKSGYRLVFIVIFLLNFLLLIAGSSGAVPFSAWFFTSDLVIVTNARCSNDAAHRLAVVWNLCPSFGYRVLHRIARRGAYPIFTPLFGWLTGRTQPVSHPVRVNQIPRQIPPTPRYLQPWVCPTTFIV